MMTLKMRLKRNGIDETDVVNKIGRKRWNDIFRDGLLTAAHFWVNNFLKLKFAPGAAQRYRFERRSRTYEAKKSRFVEHGIRPMRVGSRIVLVKTGGFISKDLVYTGDMEKQVLTQQYNPKATVTQHRQKVRVPIALGHPVPAMTSDEVGRLIRDELQTMHNIAHASIKREIDAIGIQSVGVQ